MKKKTVKKKVSKKKKVKFGTEKHPGSVENRNAMQKQRRKARNLLEMNKYGKTLNRVERKYLTDKWD